MEIFYYYFPFYFLCQIYLFGCRDIYEKDLIRIIRESRISIEIEGERKKWKWWLVLKIWKI